MAPDPISTNDVLVAVLDRECNKFTDQYFPIHAKQIRSLEAALALVNTDKHSIKRNWSKSRAANILTDLWTHVQEAYILCALATTQTSLGALKTIDYIKAVQIWWEGRQVKPRGLSEILHYHSNILPTTRGNSDFVTTTTTVEKLTNLILREHGDAPLVITCPFSGMPPPFIQIGRGLKIKVELSMEAFAELMKGTN
ncbi:hypothetical protein HIM_09991 [Hirsutella minnesotensis 3608]|uniref:Uncharacterized protein n=1 Tax=Hirsutella minnesotensis 3608 TaxID=1043627 RepID=A0A0F7ZS21_9HYPO|nr:hypothetical protein HIM_09991 [Hirsutella minnesotensis 3608]